jgi:hypothetical protein
MRLEARKDFLFQLPSGDLLDKKSGEVFEVDEDVATKLKKRLFCSDTSKSVTEATAATEVEVDEAKMDSDEVEDKQDKSEIEDKSVPKKAVAKKSSKKTKK